MAGIAGWFSVTLNGLLTLRNFKDDFPKKPLMILSSSIRAWFERPIRWMKTIFSLKSGLIFLLVALFSAFVAVMVCETVEKFIGQLLGLSKANEKNKILTFLGIGMGGILLALQAVIANRRAKAMENTANAQVEANRNTEQGQRQERLKNAIEHLGNPSDSVRLGGAYELFHLAKDTKDLRQTVMDILCAHIRRTTGEKEYRQDHPSKPSEEVQSLLTLMFVQEHEVFKSCHINLQGSWLNGAKLDRARLRDATLNETYLQGAFLTEAYLQGASLVVSQLGGAFLPFACLQGTILLNAHLEQASLTNARLQGAFLCQTNLQSANLHGAQMQGVASWAVIAVNKDILINDWLSMGFAERIRTLVDQESDVSEAIFSGGLTREDVNSITENLPDPQAKRLQEELDPHIGTTPSHRLPAGSGAAIGFYRKEEAEQWIAEYEEAMSEVSKADNKQ